MLVEEDEDEARLVVKLSSSGLLSGRGNGEDVSSTREEESGESGRADVLGAEEDNTGGGESV